MAVPWSNTHSAGNRIQGSHMDTPAQEAAEGQYGGSNTHKEEQHGNLGEGEGGAPVWRASI